VQFLIVVVDQICQTEIERKKTKKLCYSYIEQKQIVLMGIDKKKRRRKKTKESEKRAKSWIDR
jgi:hypothetical protein